MQINARAFSSQISQWMSIKFHHLEFLNEWVMVWKLKPLKIYTTYDIWKSFQISLAWRLVQSWKKKWNITCSVNPWLFSHSYDYLRLHLIKFSCSHRTIANSLFRGGSGLEVSPSSNNRVRNIRPRQLSTQVKHFFHLRASNLSFYLTVFLFRLICGQCVT